MQVTARDYQQDIRQTERELAQAFQTLKKIARHQDPKERQKIKKKIKQLVMRLQDLKFKQRYTSL